MQDFTATFDNHNVGRLLISEGRTEYVFILDEEVGDFGVEVNDLLEDETPPTYENIVSIQEAKEFLVRWDNKMKNRLSAVERLINAIKRNAM